MVEDAHLIRLLARLCENSPGLNRFFSYMNKLARLFREKKPFCIKFF